MCVELVSELLLLDRRRRDRRVVERRRVLYISTEFPD